jgi:hypothetical protein
MVENSEVTHDSEIELFTCTVNTLTPNIQQNGIDPLNLVFKKDPASETKAADNKNMISPALKKTIDILKNLIIEIDMLNQNTTREQQSTAESVDNTGSSNCKIAIRTEYLKLNTKIEAPKAEVNINTQIKEIKAMIDQFSSSYIAKKHNVGTLHGTSPLVNMARRLA